MKSILKVSVPMLLITLFLQSAFAWDYSEDNCGLPGRIAQSKAAYDCAPNVLGKGQPPERHYYEIMVFQNWYRSADLVKAALANNIPEVRRQLAKGQDANAKVWEPQWVEGGGVGHAPMYHPMSLLDFAAYIGNTELLKVLLNEPSVIVNNPLAVPDVGMSGDVLPKDPTSALSYAVDHANTDAVRIILQHPRFQITATPVLLFANAISNIRWGRSDTTALKLLLADRRLDPNTRDMDGLVFESEREQWGIEIVRNLTPLMGAVMGADVVSVKALLTSPRVIQGLELEANDGSTALQLAKKGLSKASRHTPNRAAVEGRYKEISKLLKAAGAKGWIF